MPWTFLKVSFEKFWNFGLEKRAKHIIGQIEDMSSLQCCWQSIRFKQIRFCQLNVNKVCVTSIRSKFLFGRSISFTIDNSCAHMIATGQISDDSWKLWISTQKYTIRLEDAQPTAVNCPPTWKLQLVINLFVMVSGEKLIDQIYGMIWIGNSILQLTVCAKNWREFDENSN